ncbi:MAG: OsmC family protein [Pararhodobacter sp.]
MANPKTHIYHSHVIWTGNRGTGTSGYRAYDRSWNVAVPGKAVIECSNDPLLGGDPARMNPEDLLLSALSSCHMLWYLHLAAVAGIVVHEYTDTPEGLGETMPDGAGRFLSARLHPQITVAPGTDLIHAEALHHEVHRYCFIARSVAFPVTIEAQFTIG